MQRNCSILTMTCLSILTGGLILAEQSHGIPIQRLAHTGHEHLEYDADAPSHDDGIRPVETMHHHDTLEVPAGQTMPTVTLVVHDDATQGWNLDVQTTNFRFAPERINQSSSVTEGHAHLYIDGVKITRIYGNWYYLESLAAGRHEITVSLNANGHETLTQAGEPIAATVVIEVPELTSAP